MAKPKTLAHLMISAWLACSAASQACGSANGSGSASPNCNLYSAYQTAPPELPERLTTRPSEDKTNQSSRLPLDPLPGGAQDTIAVEPFLGSTLGPRFVF